MSDGLSTGHISLACDQTPQTLVNMLSTKALISKLISVQDMDIASFFNICLPTFVVHMLQ